MRERYCHVAWVNGCFDFLHRGHIELLKWASKKGDYLIVGIDSDSRVKELKGESRPLHSQDDRKFILESLKCVNEVVIFGSDIELEQIIKHRQVDTIIVGEEYKNQRVIGHRPELGLHFFPKVNGYSTTKIIEDSSAW